MLERLNRDEKCKVFLYTLQGVCSPGVAVVNSHHIQRANQDAPGLALVERETVPHLRYKT